MQKEGIEINPELKNQLYRTVVFAKVVKDHCDGIRGSRGTKREAKQLLSFMASAAQSFINQVRASLQTEEGKRLFDAEWQRDYLAWASIFDSLIQMTDQQIAGVEAFAAGILSGEVVITQDNTEPGNKIELVENKMPACPGCGKVLNVENIGGGNYVCDPCPVGAGGVFYFSEGKTIKA